ncbi:hypothetical protein SH668x_002600 [Planctomicrobium sp. SH668]|uniref:hypothetical protein n=1 Tax=Planctomicrobium sp. SH668 TaxID=3448126 RepID=UPI003F5BED35
MPAKSLKAADKQTILKKLITEMKRRYGNSLPKSNRSAFDTLLFAICIEDATQEQAEAAFASLLEPFFDMNEIRVSSVSQIESALGELPGADWKALRIREALQHVFEKFYVFDLEFLRRKTQEQAVKELDAIPFQTSFVRGYTVQHVLGAHVLPVDQTILNALHWLGLVDAKCNDLVVAEEEVKAGIKKAEGIQLGHLLKCVALDPVLKEHFDEWTPEDEEVDPFEAASRLAELIKNPTKKKKKAKAAPAPAPKAAASSKSTATKAAAPAAKAAASTKPAKTVALKKPAKKVADRAISGKAKPAAAVKKVSKKVPAPPKKTERKRAK